MERGDMRGERMDEGKGGSGNERLPPAVGSAASAIGGVAECLSSPAVLAVWAAILAGCPAAPLTPLNMSAYSSRYSFMAAGLLCAVVLEATGRSPLDNLDRLGSRSTLMAVAGLVASALIPLVSIAILLAGRQVGYTASSLFTSVAFFIAALSWGLFAMRTGSVAGRDLLIQEDAFALDALDAPVHRRAVVAVLVCLAFMGFLRPLVLIVATSLGGLVVPDLPVVWRDPLQGGLQAEWAMPYRATSAEVFVVGYIVPAVLNAGAVVGIAALGYRAAGLLSMLSYAGDQEDDVRIHPGVLVVGSVALGMVAWALVSQAWRPSPWNALIYGVVALAAVIVLTAYAASAIKGLRAAEAELRADAGAKDVRAFPHSNLPAVFDVLTDRERDCLELALDGRPSADIAERLGIRPSTVRTYLQRAYKKCGFESLEHVRESLNGIKESDAVLVENREGAGALLSISQRFRFMLVVGLILTFAGLSAPLPYGFPQWGEAATWALAIVFGSAPMVVTSWLKPVLGRLAGDEDRVPVRFPRRSCMVPCVALASFSIGLLVFRMNQAWLHAGTFGSVLSFVKFFLLSGLIASALALLVRVRAWDMTRGSALACVAAMVACRAGVVPGAALAFAGVAIVLFVCLCVGRMAFGAMREAGPANDSIEGDDSTRCDGLLRRASRHVWSSTLALCAPALFAGIALEESMRSAFAVGDASDYLLAAACIALSVVLAVAVRRRSRGSATPILAVLACSILGAPRTFEFLPSLNMAVISLVVATACAFFASCRLGAARADQLALPALSMGVGALIGFRLFNILDDVSSNPFIAYQTPVARWSFWFPQAYIDPAAWPVLAILVLFMAALGAACIAAAIAFWRLWATAFDELEMSEAVASATFDQTRLRSYLAGRGLNDLQIAVALGILKGWTSARIARKSNYSVGAVNAARDAAYKRLRVHSKAQLAALIKRDVGF